MLFYGNEDCYTVMMKILASIFLAAIVLIGGFSLFYNYLYDKKQMPTDYKNATFLIEGTPVTLLNGIAETEVPDSVSKITTRYFGNIAKGDLNGDEIPDLAFLLTQEGGGSGTLYYAVVALQNTNNTYQGTNAIFLGDRIAPQTTEIRNGEVIVNYAVRKEGEPMTTSPRVGVSRYLTVSGALLIENIRQ